MKNETKTNNNPMQQNESDSLCQTWQCPCYKAFSQDLKSKSTKCAIGPAQMNNNFFISKAWYERPHGLQHVCYYCVTFQQTIALQTFCGKAYQSKFAAHMYCVVPENVNTPHIRFFRLNLSHPSRNSSLASYFPLKNLAFETPLPLGISVSLPWGGYGHFTELHI